MLKIRNKLTVLHDDNGVFTDYSNEALDYDRDTFSFTLSSTEDYLYVGFKKPINVFYSELSTPSTTDTSISIEYYKSSTSGFASIDSAFDETKAFQRSGFIRWDRNLADEAKTTIDSKEMYWYRMKPSIDTSAITFDGLNILFSDDQDLKKEYPEIVNSDFLSSGETNHLLTHISVRDHIIQHLRTSGAYKQTANARKEDISAFDLLDVSQVNMAARYLALSKILHTVSDEPDDTYSEKSKFYMGLYSEAIKSPFIDIDLDDDGIQDLGEELRFRTVRVVVD